MMGIFELFLRIYDQIFYKLHSLVLRGFFAKVGKRFVIGRNPFIRGGKFIRIGDECYIKDRARIEAVMRYGGETFSPKVSIGSHVVINDDFHLGAINSIEIGDHVLIGSKVYVSDHSHGEVDYQTLQTPPEIRKLSSKGSVIIEENVWLGEGVVVLPNVRIGRGSIVGANAVVTKDIPPYSVAAGVPARIIKSFGQDA